MTAAAAIQRQAGPTLLNHRLTFRVDLAQQGLTLEPRTHTLHEAFRPFRTRQIVQGLARRAELGKQASSLGILGEERLDSRRSAAVSSLSRYADNCSRMCSRLLIPSKSKIESRKSKTSEHRSCPSVRPPRGGRIPRLVNAVGGWVAWRSRWGLVAMQNASTQHGHANSRGHATGRTKVRPKEALVRNADYSFEPHPQLHSRAMQPRLHRADGHLQNRRDLLVIETLDSRQHDDRPIVIIQSFQFRQHATPASRGPSSRSRRLERSSDCFPGHPSLAATGNSSPSPVCSDRRGACLPAAMRGQIHRDAKQPGVETGPALELADVPRRLQERLLGEFLGVVQVAAQPPAGVDDAILIAADEPARASMSPPRACSTSAASSAAPAPPPTPWVCDPAAAIAGFVMLDARLVKRFPPRRRPDVPYRGHPRTSQARKST